MATALKSLIAALGAIFLAGLFFLLFFLQSVFSPVEIPPQYQKFESGPGETVRQISARLRGEDLIKSDFWFRTYVWLAGKEKLFLAGNFDLPARASAVNLVSILTNSARRDVR